MEDHREIDEGITMSPYLRDGSDVRVDSMAENGAYIVTPILYDEYYGDIDGEQIVVDEIFEKPPTKKYHAKIKKLRGTIRELKDQIVKLGAERHEFTTGRSHMMSRLRGYEELKELDALLEGTATHIVLTSRYSHTPVVIEPHQLKAHNVGLLVLRMSDDGSIRWSTNKNDYDRTTAYICTSDEQKEKVVAECIGREIRNTGFNPSLSVVERAKEYGVRVPAEYEQKARKGERDRKEREIANLKKQLSNITSKIEREEAKLDGTG